MKGIIRITDPDQIGAVAEDLRAIYGLSQLALAAESGSRQGQISRWLGGQAVPDVKTAIRLVNALGYDLALIPREDA